MKTPKEKAEELINAYYELQYGYFKKFNYRMANKCALICVDEIQSVLKEYYYLTGSIDKSIVDYWQEVKKEIEAL